MTTSTMNHLDFSAILLKTRLLKTRLIGLRKQMKKAGMEDPEFIDGLDYDPVTAEEAERILGHVEFALDLIAERANAYINQEALAAFHEIVEHIDRGLKDEWVQSLLAEESSLDSLL